RGSSSAGGVWLDGRSLLKLARSCSAMNAAPNPSAVHRKTRIAEPSPTVIHTTPKPNPTAHPRYRHVPPTVLPPRRRPCPTTIRGGAADTFYRREGRSSDPPRVHRGCLRSGLLWSVGGSG